MSLLDDLVELLPQATKYDNYISCCCIFHDDHSPSLLVNEKTYKCLSCGKWGRTKELLRLITGVGNQISEKAYKPALWWTIDLKERDYEDVALDAHHWLMNHLDYAYYLKQRGIAISIRKMYLGYLEGYYIFPILNEDRDFVGLIARAGPVIQESKGVRYIIPPGQPPLLYTDWSLIHKAQAVFAPYGVMDALSLISYGIPAVSGSVGHKIPGDLFQKIRKKIYILEDADGKDHKAAVQLMTELGWRGKVVRPDYGPGNKDLNDLLRSQSYRSLQSLTQRIIDSDSIYQWNLTVGVEQ